MGGPDSHIGPKLRIRLKPENSEAEIGLKNKKRKYVSFNNGNIEAASEDSKISLLLECNPPSLRRVEFAEVLNIKINQNIDNKEDTIDLMSDESVDNEDILDYLDNLESEAKRIIEKNGLKNKFDGQISKQDIENKELKSNVNLSDNDLPGAINAECEDENKISNTTQEPRSQEITNNSVSSPIYNNLTQINNQNFLPPQPIQIAPNVVQQPLRTFANSILLSKEKFSTRSFTSVDPNLNSKFLLKVQLPESLNQLYSMESVTQEDIKENSEIDEADKKIPIVIPTCSEWFDIDSVHPIELEMLSPIFNNEIIESRSDEKQDDKMESSGNTNTNFLEEKITSLNDEKINEYKFIRNKIIEIYRETPRQYLTVTECRKRILYTGDVSFLLKLHTYLEFWGLINFQADIKTFPPKVRKFRDYRLNDLNYTNKRTPNISRINDEAINNPFINSMLVQCVSCGKSCIYSYYILRAGVVCGVSVSVLDHCVWCIRCYSEGRYPPVLNSGHFIKVDIPILPSLNSPEEVSKTGVLGIASWTKEEVQKLIEGIEYYGDDWDAISYHIGNTKTPQECVAYFIQLPIEEPFMRNINPSKHTKPSFPFMDVSNPLMTQIALIASTVNPVVAASAAKSALDRILEIEGYKEISCESPSLSNKTAFDEAGGEKGVNSNLNTKDSHYLPQFIPKVSSAKWPSSALLGEEGIQQVCSKALENAALRAKELAEWERNEVQNIMPYLIDNTINRVELKLRQFKHLQSMIGEERNVLEARLEKIKKEDDEIKSKLISAKSQVISKQTLRL